MHAGSDLQDDFLVFHAVTVAYMPAVVRTRIPGSIWLCVCAAARCRLRCGLMVTKYSRPKSTTIATRKM